MLLLKLRDLLILRMCIITSVFMYGCWPSSITVLSCKVALQLSEEYASLSFVDIYFLKYRSFLYLFTTYFPAHLKLGISLVDYSSFCTYKFKFIVLFYSEEYYI